MKLAFLTSLLLVIISSSQVFSNTDTNNYDVLHYNIELEILDFSSHNIKGRTSVDLSPTKSIKNLHLMLKSLQVDQIDLIGNVVTYQQFGDFIELRFQTELTQNDTIQLVIDYHGVPAKDPSWGGFYFSSTDGGYAYNMGVGFADKPHNYGRIWFPCKDNFTDKATFDFTIITPIDKKAICSGVFIGQTLNPNQTISWQWKMEQEIPTYLASFAVANYEFIEWTHTGLQKEIDILLGAVASDTSNLINSFKNLDNCIDIFEQKYLPYQFNRVGFVVVPFNSGAMEHACNIAYPKYAVNGNLSRETLMAHEFAHHWWGNLVTCSTAEDMWINEGWASYSEHIFTEGIYGKEAYQDAVRTNHKYVLQYTHIRDGEARPLFPLPHDFTYGSHAYDKGSDVAHSLRAYLGDSLFFSGINEFLDKMKFKSCSSEQFRDSLSKYTAYDLTNFFANWVFEKGFPHFSLLVKSTSPTVEIDVIPALRFTSKSYLNVPMTISFFDRNFQMQEKEIILNGQRESFSFSLNFEPVFAAINFNAAISEAKTSYHQIISSTGNYDFKEALMNIEVNQLSDSALLFVEHHWVEPTHWNSTLKGIRFSDYRYWSFSGIFPHNFSAIGKIKYNGTVGNMNGETYLDHTLNIENEDSLLLMYRKDFASPWEECKDYTISTGHKTNKIGDITIHNLVSGDYCLAKYDQSAGFGAIKKSDPSIKVYPNPSTKMLHIEMADQHEWDKIRLLDLHGKCIEKCDTNRLNLVSFDLEGIAAGSYLVELSNGAHKIVQKFILE